MATRIEGGDYCINSHGTLTQGDFTDDILRRAQVLLKMRKGSFSLNDQLGSELHTLDAHSCTNELLKIFVAEALSPIKEIEFLDVERNINKKDNALSLTVYLKVAEKEIILEV